MDKLIVGLVLIMFVQCCSKDDSIVEKSLQLELVNTKTAALGEDVSIEVAIKNIDLFKTMMVKKHKGGEVVSTIDTINISDLTRSKYVFNYLIKAEDYVGGSLSFRFEATDINGLPTTPHDVSIILEPYEGLENSLVPSNLKLIARITGDTPIGETLPNPNSTGTHYNLGGTDLGIMWKMNDKLLGMWFGDSFGKDKFIPDQGATTDWRSNVLAFSSDTFLEDGLSFDSMVVDNQGNARQIIHSAHNTSGSGDFTSIPTAAIRLNNVDYVHYMNIRQWGKPGSWATNYSGYYLSQDNGITWNRAQNIEFKSDSRFAHAALFEHDGYVYMLGTVSGRFGTASLARFKPEDILNIRKYEYWNNHREWQKDDESSSSPVFIGPVGEMSLVFHTKHDRWIVTYLNENKHAIVMRDAAQIFGPWSEEKIIVRALEYPGLYGAFIHPLKINEDKLYFAMSLWGQYNVFLLSVELNK